MDIRIIIMKAISLFSGKGGDSLGIQHAGCQLMAYSEREMVFQQTHNLNFSDCKLLGNGDITQTKDDEFLVYENIIDSESTYLLV